MLIQYTCKDMGLNCSFIVRGKTIDEVTEKALAHVREVHSDDFNRIDSPSEIAKMQEALAHSTRVVTG